MPCASGWQDHPPQHKFSPMDRWLRRLRLDSVPTEYWVLSVLFLLSRVLLQGMGMRFSLELGWMFLDDPELLQRHLWRSLLNFHCYPPGMNLLTGVLLKLSSGHMGLLVRLAHVAFIVAGLLLSNSLLYLFKAVGFRARVAVILSFVFSIIPPIMYFENLYLYTYLVAMLLCVAAACLHLALARQQRFAWSGLFGAAAVLCVTRSTFHLSWLLCMVGLALVMARREQRRHVLTAALLPGLLVVGLYLKNYVRFDAFGATSAGGGNLSLITVARMPPELRAQWIREGKLSPIANVSAYSPPRDYLPYFGNPESKRWPELSALEHSTGSPNFNHWFFMEANRLRSADAKTVIRERPLEYAETVREGVIKLFEPSTEWHPHTGQATSPHRNHDQVLGGYSRAYRQLVHAWPKPFGLYWAVPFGLIVALLRAWRLRRGTTDAERAEQAVLLFSCFQIAYLVTVCSLVTFYEASRYRVEIEPFIWLTVALAVARAWQALRSRAPTQAAESPVTVGPP
jgi:hypothetical protein